jgi:sterol desaturase/sphingolipid hydroxylase (fatty acid hydroxylase superfamily)
MCLHCTAARIVAAITGLHAAAIAAHVSLKALGAVFNHTGADLQLRVMGLEYFSGAHEMHHRKPNKNYAQYVMVWDRLMGTHAPYEVPSKPALD